MNPLIAIIFLFISSYLSAQQQEQAIKPICGIHVTTMQENKMKGLLLMTKDSLLIVYPGKRKDWNKGKKYSPVIFSCSRIKRITIKKNTRVMKGMMIGTVIGTLPLLVGNSPDDKSSIAALAALTAPAGAITGAIFGITAQKTFQINGSGSSFNEFQKQL